MEQVIDQKAIKKIANDFFKQVVALYQQSSAVYGLDGKRNVFRDRQHTVSSQIEDLFAILVYDFLSNFSGGSLFCCMVDYRINVAGEIMFPDIAVIVEDPEPVIISYLDLKTDLGYKRNYHLSISDIDEKVKLLKMQKVTGRFNIKGKPVTISENIKWRTIVLSESNLGINSKTEIEEKAKEFSENFEIYFLAKGKHPNEKKLERIDINTAVFEILLSNLAKDFTSHLKSLNTQNE